MPDAIVEADHEAAAPRTAPRFIVCGQHGGHWPVTALRVLVHCDGTKHRYAVAVCGGVHGLSGHEFAELLWPAE